MASAPPCAISTIDDPERHRAAHRAHGSPLVPRAPLPARRRSRASGIARRSPPGPAPKPETGGTTRFPKSEDPRARRARALAGAGELRHAVFGLRHHGAQLPRHRPRGGCGARPRGGRPQHRAGVHGRRARHVRGHAGGSRARWSTCTRCTTSPSSSYDPKLIGSTPVKQREACQPREIAAGRAACGSSAWAPTASCARAAPRSRSSTPIQLPLSRTMQFRDSNLEDHRSS